MGCNLSCFAEEKSRASPPEQAQAEVLVLGWHPGHSPGMYPKIYRCPAGIIHILLTFTDIYIQLDLKCTGQSCNNSFIAA